MSDYVYIIAPLIAWVIAQGSKRIFHRYNKKRKIIDQSDSANPLIALVPSGGMPSAHSATVAALVGIIGMKIGIDSPLFAVALLFAAVVMYDAMMVRYSSGEQGESILSILKEIKSTSKRPKVAKGHLPSEVAVGALIGLVVSGVVFLITK